jgi:hypothetical protein
MWVPTQPQLERPQQFPHKKGHRTHSPAALALRVVAGVLTAAAVIGGAGWLMQQRAKKRDTSKR